MPMGCYNKRPEETSDDFFVRIGNAVLARELTWDGAAKVLTVSYTHLTLPTILLV